MVQRLLEMARSLREAAAGFDADLVSGEQAVAVAEELAATTKACAAAGARAALRAAGCGSHEGRGFSDAADWLARSAGSSLGEARAAMATAESAQACPATRAALAAGGLSLAQAQAITQAEAVCPGIESDLVGLAAGSSMATLRDECRKRRLASIPPEELHRRQHQARELRHWRDELGMVRLSGALPPEVGVPIVNRLDAETDRVRRAARQQGSTEARAAHAADALVAMVAGGGKGRATSAELVVVCDLGAYRRGHATRARCATSWAAARCPSRWPVAPVPTPLSRRSSTTGCASSRSPTSAAISPPSCAPPLSWGLLPTSTAWPAWRRAVAAGTDSNGTTSPGRQRGGHLLRQHQTSCWPHHRAKTDRDRAAGLLGSWAGPPLGRQPP